MPTLIVLALLTAAIAFKIYTSYQKYRTYELVSDTLKRFGYVIGTGLLGLLAYISFPYNYPPSSSIGIVLGNTQNAPGPQLNSGVLDEIKGTLMQHRGETTDTFIQSIIAVSAVKEPYDIPLDSLKLVNIRNNSANASEDIDKNFNVIKKYLNSVAPTDDGANYLDAILEARRELSAGQNTKTTIVVIGSGLSDSGDLDFAHSDTLSGILNAKSGVVDAAVDKIADMIDSKYGMNYLDGYRVVFYGLGDTVAPQEQLRPNQKNVVSHIYSKLIQRLGGVADVENGAGVTGKSVATDYVVSTTDTGCGDVGLTFDDESVKFVANSAAFADPLAARSALRSVETIYEKGSGNITGIQVDGYIAHVNVTGETLSQARANAVKALLVDMGMPASKVTAKGKGFGPHNIPAKDRMVKITINRNSVCGE